MTVRKVAIVGAGASGLAAIKICLEHHFDPICFEKSCDIGGWWNCQVLEIFGDSTHPRVLQTAVTRNSKHFMAFSDFPPPKHYPNFLPQAKYLQYLRKYMAKFNLDSHILFNCEVIDIKKAETYSDNGKLIVEYRERKSSRVNTETLDAVFLCTGHWTKPYFPEIPGIKEFRLLHSSKCKPIKNFENRRVLVLGLNNNSVDLCVQLTQVASQVYLSTNGKEGAWLMSRMAEEGVPLDSAYLTDWKHILLNARCTAQCAQRTLEKQCKNRYDSQKFGMKPKNPLWKIDQPIISDELPLHIGSGKIVVKPAVCSFQSFPLPFILFEDGSIETGIDSVIVDAGFDLEFPSLRTLVPCNEDGPVLYNHIFPVNLSHLSLAVIGLVYPLQGGDNSPVISEMQCRFVCQALTTQADSTKIREKLSRKRDELVYERNDSHIRKTSYLVNPKKSAAVEKSNLLVNKSPIYVDFIAYMNKLGIIQILHHQNLISLLSIQG